MNCARCGNRLYRLPMFDLPRRVQEFSCLCCGERFWTIDGDENISLGEISSSQLHDSSLLNRYGDRAYPASHQN